MENLRRLISENFEVSSAIMPIKSSNHLSKIKKKVSKIAKLNTTTLLAVSNYLAVKLEGKPKSSLAFL